jgi:circadian clock protein KaiC
MTNRLKTGIAEFDEMLGGGFLEGDAVMLAGGPGTGKTNLALEYLMAGIASGQPGIYLSFEELPDQIYRDAMTFGWDLKKMEKEDKLRVMCTSPELLLGGTDAAELLADPIKEIKARRIVIDSLSHLSMFVKGDDMRKETYRLMRYFKTKDLSSVLIWESPQTQGQSFAVSDAGLSFIVDTMVLLRYVEIDSDVRKAITVLKMRGSAHDKRLREYEITQRGIEILAPFGGLEGITTGTARRVSKSIDDLIRKFDETIPENGAGEERK